MFVVLSSVFWSLGTPHPIIRSVDDAERGHGYDNPYRYGIGSIISHFLSIYDRAPNGCISSHFGFGWLREALFGFIVKIRHREPQKQAGSADGLRALPHVAVESPPSR